MSFRPSGVQLALGKRLTVVPKGRLPVLLRDRIKVAEQREKEYAAQVAEATARGSPIPPFKEMIVPKNLKYYTVSRSQSGNLPVYTDYRANGDCSTEIRKIQGDSVSCMRELNAYLENIHIDPLKDAPRASLKQTSGNLVIKGNMRATVEDWMRQKGF